MNLCHDYHRSRWWKHMGSRLRMYSIYLSTSKSFAFVVSTILYACKPVLQEAEDRLSDQLPAAEEYVDSIGHHSIAAGGSNVVTKYTREFRITCVRAFPSYYYSELGVYQHCSNLLEALRETCFPPAQGFCVHWAFCWAMRHSSAALKAWAWVMAFSVRFRQSRISWPKKG